MEIIKLNWPEPWPIVDACSDATYEAYLEDELVRRAPGPLITGAFDLLVSSMTAAVERHDAEYIVHLEADTWIFDQQIIVKYLHLLHANPDAVFAASSWSVDRLPDWKRSRKIGPRLRYILARALRPLGGRYGIRARKTVSTQFFIAKTTPDFMQLLSGLTVKDGDYLEGIFYKSIIARFGRRGIIGMPEREPVHPQFQLSCKALSLYCQHCPSAQDAPAIDAQSGANPPERLHGKKESLAIAGFAQCGPHMRRLLEADDLSYYNGNAKRTNELG
jgi:hypothetical protein